jgi:hypothetical protein
MSMIGDNVPAPKLREIQWTDDAMKSDVFEQVHQVFFFFDSEYVQLWVNLF